MSVQYGKVISLIVSERFGPVVEKVTTYLFQYGASPLIYIKKSTDLPLSKVKEALCVLIKYQLVSFSPNKNENIANYTLIAERIFLMLRYPKYINLIKTKLGDECEMFVEEVLQRGYSTASLLILKVYERLKKNEHAVTIQSLKEKFESLVNAQYLRRLPNNKDDSLPVPTLQIADNEHFSLPKIDSKLLINIANGTGSEEDIADKNIYWTINFDRFHQDMRDRLIANCFTRKFDENAGEFVKLLLRQMYIRTEAWADVSNPIPILEIKNILRKQKSHPKLEAFFDQYVNVIEQDNSKLIRKAGEASGGSFQIYIKEAFAQFTWEAAEQIVMEKFDSKAARIFRLVKLKNYIEPDQIQQLVMIPAKEAKMLSYQLLEENFLEIQELRKPSSTNGPIKSFTLFHINFPNVVRMLLDLCYKSLFNAMTRRGHEKVINRRIINKKHRVDTIARGLREQGADEEQLADIEDMITPPERELLENIDRMMKKLNIVELEIDETIFLFEMFLKYH